MKPRPRRRPGLDRKLNASQASNTSYKPKEAPPSLTNQGNACTILESRSPLGFPGGTREKGAEGDMRRFMKGYVKS